MLDAVNDNGRARDERAITVGAAARRLGCDHTTVRSLLRKGHLAGIRIGKGDNPKGVRVKVWSIKEWEWKHAIGGLVDVETHTPPLRRARSNRNRADEEAAARLEALSA